MPFAERYCRAVNSSDLRDDEHHHSTDALIAAASADRTGSGVVLGSLLSRVKYADGRVHKTFEAGTINLAALLRIWTDVVTARGRSRGWLKIVNPWDIHAAHAMYTKIAHASLAYWLDGHCEPCKGAGQTPDRRICTCCKGSGKAAIEGGRLEAEYTRDMVSELEGMYQAHSARAAAMLRRVA